MRSSLNSQVYRWKSLFTAHRLDSSTGYQVYSSFAIMNAKRVNQRIFGANANCRDCTKNLPHPQNVAPCSYSDLHVFRHQYRWWVSKPPSYAVTQVRQLLPVPHCILLPLPERHGHSLQLSRPILCRHIYKYCASCSSPSGKRRCASTLWHLKNQQRSRSAICIQEWK